MTEFITGPSAERSNTDAPEDVTVAEDVAVPADVTVAEDVTAGATAQPGQGTPTLLEQLGGAGGLVSSAIPSMIFVAVNLLAGLQPAIWASLGVAVAVGVWRLVRREPLAPAVSGILGVAVCAFIAYRTGEARGFFLYGIWYSLVAGLALALSVVVRRPLVGVLWSVLNGSGFGWRASRRARFGFDVATAVWAVFFLARFGVQYFLYVYDQTGWLGVARLAMGLPLTAVAALVTIWAIRRAVPVADS